MVQVIWAAEAIRNLEEARAYVACDNATAATRLVDRLRAAGNSLENFPDRGRPIRGGRRELPTVPPYILQYRVLGDAVLILRVKHGRQRR